MWLQTVLLFPKQYAMAGTDRSAARQHFHFAAWGYLGQLCLCIRFTVMYISRSCNSDVVVISLFAFKAVLLPGNCTGNRTDAARPERSITYFLLDKKKLTRTIWGKAAESSNQMLAAKRRN